MGLNRMQLKDLAAQVAVAPEVKVEVVVEKKPEVIVPPPPPAKPEVKKPVFVKDEE